MHPPRFDPDAETWFGLCPWCGQEETHQVGAETAERAALWCRTCSGGTWLTRGSDTLEPRSSPKKLHDKRRVNGKRLPKQTEPVVGGGHVPQEYRGPRF